MGHVTNHSGLNMWHGMKTRRGEERGERGERGERRERRERREVILISKQRLREVAEFLAPNRLHMKQGLLDTQYRDPLSPPNFLRGFGFNNEALKFFMGAKLTSDEQLKIDKTLVAEVD